MIIIPIIYDYYTLQKNNITHTEGINILSHQTRDILIKANTNEGK